MSGTINMTIIPPLYLKDVFQYVSILRDYYCLKRKNFDEHFLFNSFILSYNKNLALIM